MKNRQTNERTIASLPRLHDACGDLKKQWFVFYYARNPKSGKNVRFRIYEGFPALKTAAARHRHAEKLIEEYGQKLRAGWSPFDAEEIIFENDLRYRKASEKYQVRKKANRSFDFFFNEFLRVKKGRLRESTMHTYRSKMRWFLHFLKKNNMGEADVSAFDMKLAVDLQEFLKSGRNLGNKSINAYNLLLRELFDFINERLEPEGRQIVNVFKKIKRYPEEQKHPQVYNMTQLRRLGEVISEEDPQLWLMLRMLFNCFIRPRELRFLKIGDIDFIAGRVKIRAEISKNKKDGVVDIPSYIIEEMIDKGFHNQPVNFYVFSTHKKPWLKPVGKNYFFNHFDKFRKRLHLENYIMYAFKHTGVAELKRSGADWLEIKEQLRHHSLDQVIQYGHSLLGKSSEHIREKGPKI